MHLYHFPSPLSTSLKGLANKTSTDKIYVGNVVCCLSMSISVAAAVLEYFLFTVFVHFVALYTVPSNNSKVPV